MVSPIHVVGSGYGLSVSYNGETSERRVLGKTGGHSRAAGPAVGPAAGPRVDTSQIHKVVARWGAQASTS